MTDNTDTDETTMRLFQRDWAIYRKMVENNFLFHREAYGRLQRLLAEEAPAGFRFLDIACGDASAATTALRDSAVGHYHGIDLSAPALALARAELSALSCPVVLDRRDFTDALSDRPEPADVAWIGLSLHHFHPPEKLKLMQAIRGVVGERGTFAIYENTMPDGETRDQWMARWDRQKPLWTAYSEDEWDAMWTHVHTFDFPETDSDWRRLGREAGFGTVRQLFAAPTDLFRMYAFSA